MPCLSQKLLHTNTQKIIDTAKIVNGKLRLDKPHGIKTWYDIRFKGAKSLDGDLKVVSVYRENDKYWASLPFEVEIAKKIKTGNVLKASCDNLVTGY